MSSPSLPTSKSKPPPLLPPLSPVFVCLAVFDEQLQNRQQQQQQHKTINTAAGAAGGANYGNINNSSGSSSGAHSGTSPPPSMCCSHSGAGSSVSQDSAICAFSSSSSSSPLPPPDPGAAPAIEQHLATTTTICSGQQVMVAWTTVDYQAAVQQQNKGLSSAVLSNRQDEQRYSSGYACKIDYARLDVHNSLDQLNKIAENILNRNPGRTCLLHCHSRALRQSLYSLCAQTYLAKLSDQGEEQVFSSRLPLFTLFHRFLPYPLPLTTTTTINSSNSLPQAASLSTNSSSANFKEQQRQQYLGKNLPTIPGEEWLEQQVRQMAKELFEQLLTVPDIDGGMEKLLEKWTESVQQGYRPALCMDPHAVNPRSVVLARGLPWQVSDMDVALFFAGLDIAPGGIALCLGPEGRRNGECLVRFQRLEHRDLALERHRLNLRQRYIEVYRAGADKFIRHSVGIVDCALEFAQRADSHQQAQDVEEHHSLATFNNNATVTPTTLAGREGGGGPEVEGGEAGGEQQQYNGHNGSGEQPKQPMIIRMRGLPFTATEQQIREFFTTTNDGQQQQQRQLPSGILEHGVLFVHRADGRPSGDAFVLFGDEQSGRRALQRHRQRMGTRYIELFRTTQAEVQQLFNTRQQQQQQQFNAGTGDGEMMALVNGNGGPASTNRKQQQTLLSSTMFPSLGGSQSGGGKHQQQRLRDCLRLRGLPFEAQVQQVVEFMGSHARAVLFQGVHMIYNAAGHPSGEAFIQMESEHAAAQAAQECHNKFMELGKKRRYIEVFQCCAEDMSLMLNIMPTPPTPMMANSTMTGPAIGTGMLTANGPPAPLPPPLFPLHPAAASPLLAFPPMAASAPFLPAFTTASGTGGHGHHLHQQQHTDPTAIATTTGFTLFAPQFSAPALQLYCPDPTSQLGAAGHPQPPTLAAAPPEFWVRNGLTGAFRIAAAAANMIPGSLPMPPHTAFSSAEIFPLHSFVHHNQHGTNGHGGHTTLVTSIANGAGTAAPTVEMVKIT